MFFKLLTETPILGIHLHENAIIYIIIFYLSVHKECSFYYDMAHLKDRQEVLTVPRQCVEKWHVIKSPKKHSKTYQCHMGKNGEK